MTWKIDLPHGAKGRYTQQIKDMQDELVQKDPNLDLLNKSNCSFENFVMDIRKVAEDAYPDEDGRPKHVRDLIKNVNWCHHGKNNKKWPHTDVTEEHCDKMVEYYSDLVDQYNPEYAEGSHDAQVDDLDGQFQNFTVY